MKTVLTTLCAIIILSSCGFIRNASKSSFKEVTASEVAETAIVKEKTDTIITIEAHTARASVPISEATDTMVTVIDTHTQSVEVKYDPVTKRINAKAVVKKRDVRVVVDKETIVQKQEKTESKSISKKVKKEKRSFSLGWIWIVLIFLLGYLVYRWYRKYI